MLSEVPEERPSAKEILGNPLVAKSLNSPIPKISIIKGGYKRMNKLNDSSELSENLSKSITFKSPKKNSKIETFSHKKLEKIIARKSTFDDRMSRYSMHDKKTLIFDNSFIMPNMKIVKNIIESENFQTEDSESVIKIKMEKYINSDKIFKVHKLK